MYKNLLRRVLCNKLLLSELFVKSSVCASTSFCYKLSSPQPNKFQTFQIRYFSNQHGGEVTSAYNSKDTGKKIDEHQAQEDTKLSDDDIRIKVFDSALNHVVQHGWSQKAISLGAEEAGFPMETEGKFEENDLLMHFVRESNGKLLDYLQENAEHYNDDKNKLIRDALEYRLRLTIPYIDVWAEAMKMLLSSKLFSESTDELSKMVDDIWCYAGDQSNDVEWYIKRGALAQLYAGLQLVMLTDQSEDYKDTWTFLDQRFKDLENFKELSQRVKENQDNLANIIKNFSLYSSRKR